MITFSKCVVCSYEYNPKKSELMQICDNGCFICEEHLISMKGKKSCVGCEGKLLEEIVKRFKEIEDKEKIVVEPIVHKAPEFETILIKEEKKFNSVESEKNIIDGCSPIYLNDDKSTSTENLLVSAFTKLEINKQKNIVICPKCEEEIQRTDGSNLVLCPNPLKCRNSKFCKLCREVLSPGEEKSHFPYGVYWKTCSKLNIKR